MSRVRTWVSLTLVAVAAVLAAGWLLLVSPKHDEAAALREQVSLQESTNALAQTRLAALRDKAERLPEQTAALAEVATKIPDEVGLPDLIRALTAAAGETGVELVSVTPGAPAPLEPAGTAPAAPADGTTPASTPAATPAATGGAVPGAPAAPAAAAGTAISSVPIALTVAGSYYDTEEFLATLEDLPRAFRVTTLTVAPGGSSVSGAGTVLTSSIAGLVYVTGSAAAPAAADAGATVPAPAVTTEQQPAGAS